jgi:thiol-disulfide isomerase/thioredoxin
MKHDAVVSRRIRTVGWIVVASIGVIAFPPSAFSAERVVLMESFTATWCSPCNLAAPVIGNLIELYGANGTDPELSGTLAVVQYHVSDPPWNEQWGEERADFYDVWGIPYLWYDGQLGLVGYPNDYLGAYQQRQAIPTPVTMSLRVEQTGPTAYTVTVETCLEPDASTLNLTVYTVMMEDHYPPGHTVSQNTFRWAAPTSNVQLNPGQCAVMVKEFLNVAPITMEENLKVAAWAQVPNPSPPAPVYQAAIAAYPFAPPCPWDLSGDGNVFVTDLLLLLASWGSCEGCPADFSGDGLVNVTDLLALIANFGPCPGVPCVWDVNGDDVVDQSDLEQVLDNFGDCDGCAEDVNGDGEVNGLDAAAVAQHFGPCP